MGKIAFQGEAGANSHIACQNCYPDMEVMACATFEQTFAALREEAAVLAMIPVENTVAGAWRIFTVCCRLRPLYYR